MKEKTLRQLHRSAALICVLFIFIQTITGIILTIEILMNKYWGGPVHEFHYDLGIPGVIYRLLLGAGLLWISSTGILIYLKIRARTKKAA